MPAEPSHDEEAEEENEEASEEDADEEDEDDDEEPEIVSELKALDDRYLSMLRDMEREVEQVRQRHLEHMKGVLEERARVLNGQTDAPALPGFWRQAMANHPALDGILEEWDAPVLLHLTDVTCVQRDRTDRRKGFRLEFEFAENEFFTNRALWKEYISEEHSPYTGALDVSEVQASAIQWNEGKDVTVHLVTKKKKKGGGAKKAAKPALQPRSSFFRMFFRNLREGEVPEDIVLPDEEAVDDIDLPSLVSRLLEQDHDLGCAFRDSLVPFAVRWYTGEAMPECPEVPSSEDCDEEEEDDEQDAGVGDEAAHASAETPKQKAQEAASSSDSRQAATQSSTPAGTRSSGDSRPHQKGDRATDKECKQQ